jgi:hypothetical protein
MCWFGVCGDIYVIASWKCAVSHWAGPSDVIPEFVGTRGTVEAQGRDIMLFEEVRQLTSGLGML